jgi:uncharacterized protein YdeI (YjbR/CyaY-like superfamily)
VQEALCFGWIDSLPRKLDADRTMHYLSPRKPKSMWSAVNKRHVEELVAKGLMTAAGLRKIEAAKADGSWDTLNAVDALEMPTDLRKALAKDKAAKKHFDAFPRSARKFILYWVGSAKTEATRTKRIEETVRCAVLNIRVGLQRPV